MTTTTSMESVIDSIAKWASPHGDDLLVGHVQGPALTACGASDDPMAVAIWKALSFAAPEMLVAHITNKERVEEVGLLKIRNEGWATALFDSGNSAATFEYEEMSYHQLSQRLLNNTIPPANEAQPKGWQSKGTLPCRVLFVVDIDPDVSAEFAVLLGALVTWATGTCAKQKAGIRILTMSHEPIHHAVKGFLSSCDISPIAQFAVAPKREPAEVMMTSAEPGRDAFSLVSDSVRRNPDGRHVVLWFRSRETVDEWPDWEMWDAGIDHACRPTMEASNRHFYLMKVGTRVADIFTDSDFVHVIASGTRERYIFDQMTNQVAWIKVKTSASERQEQMQWGGRADCAGSQVVVYADQDFLNGLGEARTRRVDAATVQLLGFLAGMSQFADWPVNGSSLLRCVTGTEAVGVDVILERLIQQRLIDINGPGLPSFRLSSDERKILYQTLPLVQYDGRIAWLLSMPSRSPISALAKVQLAALLTVGIDRVLVWGSQFRQHEAKVVRSAAKVGISGPFATYGSLWLALGLIKVCHSRTIKESGWTLEHMPFSNPLQTIIDNVLSVDLSVARKFTFLASRLADVLALNGVDIRRCSIPDESKMAPMDWDDFDDVSWCLLRVFVHHLTTMQPKEGPGFYDVHSCYEFPVSDALLESLSMGRIIEHEAEIDLVSGIYTQLSRLEDRDTIMIDWTWILSSLISRWVRRYGNLDAFLSPLPMFANRDEA